MTEPIEDAETMTEAPQSFEPTDDEELEVTIVHHNGSIVIDDFAHIEEIDVESGRIRVWWDEVYGNDFTDYYGATITQVDP